MTDSAVSIDRPLLAIDVVILTAASGSLRVLLVKRAEAPEQGLWALPGGLVRREEGLDEAARRILAEKALLTDVFLEQLYTFGQPDRDPRSRVVTVAYMALVPPHRLTATARRCVADIRVPWAGESGGAVALYAAGESLDTAFDHDAIIATAVLRIRGKLAYTNIGFELLGPRFTLRELRLLHETILGQPLNKDSFRRRVLATKLVESTGIRQEAVGHRPALLYRFGSTPADDA